MSIWGRGRLWCPESFKCDDCGAVITSGMAIPVMDVEQFAHKVYDSDSDPGTNVVSTRVVENKVCPRCFKRRFGL